ncbi:cation transporter [Thiomicrorhabdus sp. ZW0627]|uniref:cation transporter n=1 Tax=Thiomicrorhabdus sp. ZW0627 TaxID=3039774 RepID=UPI0024373548|nr:cation transporter [Thiomicrorhabdus sp. ZW0627]MDG6774196.1 cation transporter [Thiomicrorhabdus sp. ZW0627]
MACECHIEVTDASQKKLLITLLAINAALFVIEFFVGWYAQSTGLTADALDMLADAIVYGIGLYAIGRAAQTKAKAALVSGYFQMMLAALIGIDIARRALYGSEPISEWMMIMGIIALIGNTYCLKLIHAHRNGEVHMRASWIFSANDVLANLGVIISGLLVWWLGSRLPDLIIGSAITLLVFWGAMRILKDAKSELQSANANTCDSEKEETCCSGSSCCEPSETEEKSPQEDSEKSKSKPKKEPKESDTQTQFSD